MNKAEYKKISHDIRYAAFRDARYRAIQKNVYD